MKGKDKKYIGILFGLVVFLGLFFLFSDYLFGSKTDWLGQHTAFPEYFRNLFYETKNLFPSFSMHLGSGQNIFNFSYYGLFSPIILISYLLPFVEMTNYLMIMSFIGIFASMVLLYYFLKPKLGENIAFVCCLLYFLACPIIFHAHRHLMFVNYMPFLIWGLIGVDRYFSKKKVLSLTISVFFMILTSYYYSIGGIVVLVIYGIYKYLSLNKFQIRTFLKEGIQFVIPILFGVLLSAFLLLPTAYSLLNGREGGESSISLLSLLIPNWNLNDVLYSTYALGVTSIFIIALLSSLIHSKKEKKWLGYTLLCVCFLPIFVYLLNGTLYVRTKSLIPFLPLVIYMIGSFMKEVEESKVSICILSIALVLFHGIFFLGGFHDYLYYIDLVITLSAIILYFKYRKKWLLYIPIVGVALVVCIGGNLDEGYVKKSYSEKNVEYLVEQIPETESLWRTSVQTNTLYGINQIYRDTHLVTSLYSSTYNASYSNFYRNIFDKALPYRNRLILASTNHLPFQMLMGERYIITDCQDWIGYSLLLKKGDLCLYENTSVYPIGYSSASLMSKDTFSKLAYPYSIEALMNYIVIEDSTGLENVQSQIQEITLSGTYEVGDLIQVAETKSGYTISAESKDMILYTLEEPMWNQLLLIDFMIEEEPSCKEGDFSITINGITNKLTCSSWQYKNENYHFTYILSEEKLEDLEITFSKGVASIQDIHIYEWDYEDLQNGIQKIAPFEIDMNQTKGDKIVGDISVEEDGYFVLSIPYDLGFEIEVDGKIVPYEKVNTAFIGFTIETGEHHIVITYEAPYYRVGKIVSFVSFGLYILYLVLYKKYQK